MLFCWFNKLHLYHLAGVILLLLLIFSAGNSRITECVGLYFSSIVNCCDGCVPSDLHANDRKHDMQPSTQHTHEMVSNARRKKTAHGALSLMKIMFGQCESGNREREREERAGEGKSNEKSRRKNLPNPIPFSHSMLS